jgi:hypothetical protein
MQSTFVLSQFFNDLMLRVDAAQVALCLAYDGLLLFVVTRCWAIVTVLLSAVSSALGIALLLQRDHNALCSTFTWLHCLTPHTCMLSFVISTCFHQKNPCMRCHYLDVLIIPGCLSHVVWALPGCTALHSFVAIYALLDSTFPGCTAVVAA